MPPQVGTGGQNHTGNPSETDNSFSCMSTSVKPQTHHKNNTTDTHTQNSLSQKQDKKHMDNHGTHETWTMQPKPTCCKDKDL